ncbi:50S ribosomal protein L6 [Candidatus Marinimicrobia bacterium]|nr:50S ribosomal protein L6 [Candidatus Neomarinimicrobiota bacterium]
MSRIGNSVITVPEGVKIESNPQHLLVTGPKGELSVGICDEVTVKIEDNNLSVSRNADDKVSKAMHGTTRQLVFNAIEGVTNGFSKHLEIIGVGYNAKSQNNRVILQLGFSHDIIFDLPEGIEAIADGKKGDKLEIKGINKQIVGQVAAKIRSLRKPEPYKGKGIRYKDEYVRSKQGKTVGGGE